VPLSAKNSFSQKLSHLPLEMKMTVLILVLYTCEWIWALWHPPSVVMCSVCHLCRSREKQGHSLECWATPDSFGRTGTKART